MEHPVRLRDPAYDIIRGIMVLLMVLSHSILFFHDQSNTLLNIIGKIGNSAAFTVFLAVSGAVSALAYADGKRQWKRGIARTGVIYGAYLIIALSSAITQERPGSIAELGRIAGEIISFTRVPMLSEFILPFIFFWALTAFVPSFLRFIQKSVWTLIGISAISYLLGWLLYVAPLPSWTIPYVAIFAGHESVLRFPLFHYLPVFLLGAWISGKGNDARQLLAPTITLIIISTLSFGLSQVVHTPYLDPFNRWPPSVGFLAAGSALFLILLTTFRSWIPRSLERFYRMLAYLGKDSFDIYITHSLLLFLYAFLYGTRTSDPATVIAGFSVVIALATMLSSLNAQPGSRFLLPSVRPGLTRRYRIKKRYLLALGVLGVFAVGQLTIRPDDSPFGGIVTRASLEDAIADPLAINPDTGLPVDTIPWGLDAYTYRRQILITNQDLLLIPQDQEVRFAFNHESLVNEGKSANDGSDLAIGYLRDGIVDSIPIRIDGAGTNEAVVSFRTIASIPFQSIDNRYFLYTGSDAPLPLRYDGNADAARSSYLIRFGPEEHLPLFITTDRKWYLRTIPNGTAEPSVRITITGPVMPDSRITITPQGSDNPVWTAAIEKNFMTIPVRSLPTGNLVILAVHSTTPVALSSTRTIHISEPLLVAFTLDWEGWDTPDSVLQEIDRIFTNNNIPLTHFWNPRIYVPDALSEERRDALTAWVITRHKEQSHEIALHLHMFLDMVSEAGVTPKTEPSWGMRTGTGYDVPLTAYSLEETTALLAWSLDAFREKGLPRPTGFRAGGWFADEEVFAALRLTGFAYDGSGRDNARWNNGLPNPWNLNILAQPYVIQTAPTSQTDTDRNTLLEIPNNGGNGYEHDAQELTRRYRAQFPSTHLDEPRSIVFIAHPEWHTREFPKMEFLLSSVNENLYSADKGPVVFTTMQDTYSMFRTDIP